MSQETIANEKLELIKKDVESFVEQGGAIVIDSPESLADATEYLSNCMNRWKRIEEIRTDLVKPLNDTVKKINNGFKDQQAPLKDQERIIKAGISKYQMALIAKQREDEAVAEAAKAELEAAAAKATTPAAKKAAEEAASAVQAPVAAAPTTVNTSAGSTSMRTVWKFEVEDAAKVPSNYKVVDDKLIRAAVAKGERSIPGVRIYEDAQVSVR